jgi:hypothetical protein
MNSPKMSVALTSLYILCAFDQVDIQLQVVCYSVGKNNVPGEFWRYLFVEIWNLAFSLNPIITKKRGKTDIIFGDIIFFRHCTLNAKGVSAGQDRFQQKTVRNPNGVSLRFFNVKIFRDMIVEYCRSNTIYK